MGKGGGSCLKIIACAGDPADTEDEEPLEEKASSSKRKWSFRKRSTSHRILSNHVGTESTTTLAEDVRKNPELDSKDHPEPSSPEKISVVKFEEPAILYDILEPEASDSVSITDEVRDSDAMSREPIFIIIQAAIRGYLARKEFIKVKQIVKLQAAVRGHLVRREAVDTLRCAQAIVKMQALVRDRLRIAGKLVHKEVKEINHDKQKKVHSSKRLFENRFACWLLESTSSKKTKVIHISCDTSRSGSGWKWLERWMAITSLDVQHKTYPNACVPEQNIEYVRCSAADVVIEEKNALVSHTTIEPNEGIEFRSVEVQIANISPPSASTVDCADVPFESVINGKTKHADLEAPTSFEKKDASSQDGNLEMFKDTGITKTSCDSNLDQSSVKSDAIMQSETLCEKHAIDLEKSSTARRIDEPQEIVSKKFEFGMRKACSPAFTAVQSKFEEMTSMPNTSGAFDPFERIAEEKNSDSSALQTHCCSKPECDSMEHWKSVGLMPENVPLLKQEFSFIKDSTSHETRVHMTSECGTEISISSTLDSPDRSEPEGEEIVLDISALERRDYDKEGAYNFCHPDSNSDSKKFLTYSGTHKEPIFEENEGRDNGNHVSDTMDSTCDKQLLVEMAASDTSDKLIDATIDQQTYKTSPEGSPRSPITASESHGTPASQVSVNTKKNRQNNTATGRPRFQLTGKSLANKKIETAAKCKSEHLPKDSKASKRRSTLGTIKPECNYLEPRSSSCNSLPNYMQATESARAKIHTSNSPKASPDMHDKDSYHRKRHSLPLSNTKQGSSPQMQRSSSQVQQSSKGTGVQSPHTSET